MNSSSDPPTVFAELRSMCDQTVRAAAFGTSVYVAASAPGGEVTWATGTNMGRPVAPDALCELHCLTKPIVAWSLLEVISRHGFEPTEPISAVIPEARHLDGSVTVLGICNHLTRLAQPAALDWVTRPTTGRPTIADLRQQPAGSWYSEVGAWMLASELIRTLTGGDAAEAIADLVERCDADTYIGNPVPSDRQVIVPIAGLPQREIPMLHVEHPTYRARLGPAFGGFGSMAGYVRFLGEVGRSMRREPSAIVVADEVLDAVMAPAPSMPDNETWRRPARFVGGFLDASTPHEPGQAGMLVMFAGIGSAACLLDPAGNRQVAYYSDAASFDASDHQFLRRELIGAFLDDTAIAS
jgi:CubicO group peptidase (beta-lactamase class C family)